MRLTSLLDSFTADAAVSTNPTHSAPTRPASALRAPAPAPAPATSEGATATAPDFDREPVVPSRQGGQNPDFDRMLDGLLPCRTEDPELWFAERTADVDRAKSLCQACPLQAGCLQGAMDRAEPWGVWGGEVFVDGKIVAVKRGRGRPRKVHT